MYAETALNHFVGTHFLLLQLITDLVYRPVMILVSHFYPRICKQTGAITQSPHSNSSLQFHGHEYTVYTHYDCRRQAPPS